MVILKIPIVYLCFVVYYAIKATPLPEEGAEVTRAVRAGLGPFLRLAAAPPAPFPPRPARRPCAHVSTDAPHGRRAG